MPRKPAQKQPIKRSLISLQRLFEQSLQRLFERSLQRLLERSWQAILSLPPPLLILLASFLWAATHAMRKELLGAGYSPFWMTCTMGLMVAILLPPLLRISLKDLLKSFRLAPIKLCLYGILGVATGTLFFYMALQLLPLSLASPLTALESVMVVMLAVLFLKERPHAQFFLWAGVALAAATLLLLKDPLALSSNLKGLNWLGLLALLGAISCWAVGMLVNKKLVATEIPGAHILFWRYASGSVAMLLASPFFMQEALRDWHQLVSPQSIDSMAIFWHLTASFLGSLPPYLMFYHGMRHLDLSRITLLELSRPAFGVLLGLIIFGELLTLWQWLALPIFFFAIYQISQTPKAKEPIPNRKS